MPLRKPGICTESAIFLVAASTAGLSSSKGTSTVSFTLVGLSFSDSVFTGQVSLWMDIGWTFLAAPRGSHGGYPARSRGDRI